MSSWRRDFASGLVVLVPLIVILYVLSILYGAIVRIPGVDRLLEFPEPYTYLSEVFGFFVAIIIFLLLVLSVGYLMRTTAGRLLESGLDAAMNKVPLVRVIYNASKLAVETALTGTEDLQKPVRLETWPGIRMTAFKTGKTTKDGKEIVFMPTAPNITTGFVMEVDPEDIEETGEKVEEALTRVLSAGFAEQDHVDEFNIEVTEESGDGRVPSNE
ncbi:DUF502 domain-containing protein [Haloferax sp. Atlit-10N]|uniref:DUF502 domain-containing protein n=1 Tax=Haloferax prahovense (strain DSM 18310 / JCM 13924 / TL6) TaxID=1227461 RepID=M0GP74_HALPT|nr:MULTISPECIES: DUF502 domain-containing protein [Haloferax]ELZ74006.1 hypothetical protein C457_01955 [Haloferax prahovense DSM 18310]RDZ46141.1 DUF502 domain-containing protein [Haloferax sp. Atlit-16N]RDZ59974.1 DUF502 domain-containing protein [Haloferax sp. Atlit-10N]